MAGITNGARDLRRALLGVHTSVLLISLRSPYVVESMYMDYELLIVCSDILRLDILCLVCLEQVKTIADLDEALEDGLFVGVYGVLVER